jgi:hypothetical protein
LAATAYTTKWISHRVLAVDENDKLIDGRGAIKEQATIRDLSR